MFIQKTKGMSLNHLFDADSSHYFPSVEELSIGREFLSVLHNGTNYMDVFSNNSGFVGCRVKFTIIIDTETGESYKHEFNIWDGQFTEVPFRTIPEERTFGTCDQFRIPIEVKV